jgi:hypothetical protein
MPQLSDIHSWDEDFLLSLPVAEASYIEFKESQWLVPLDEEWRNSVSKYLSAFANYDGGYLIVGVRDPTNTGEIKPDGGIQNGLKKGIVAWLQNTLPSLVKRPLERLDIWPIGPKNESSSISEGHSVLVIHVPASEAAPHQARDDRYYTRHGSRLSSLGHQAIMDIAGRRKNPTVKLVRVRLLWTKMDKFFLSVTVENTSTTLARFFSVALEVPARVGKEGLLSFRGVLTTTDDGFHVVRLTLGNALSSPLFPLSTATLKKELEVSVICEGADEFRTRNDVHFKLFADEMPFIEGTIPFDQVLERQSS